MTIWAVLQSELVKVSSSPVGPLSVRCVSEWPVMVTVVVAVGSLDSFTV